MTAGWRWTWSASLSPTSRSTSNQTSSQNPFLTRCPRPKAPAVRTRRARPIFRSLANWPHHPNSAVDSAARAIGGRARCDGTKVLNAATSHPHSSAPSVLIEPDNAVIWPCIWNDIIPKILPALPILLLLIKFRFFFKLKLLRDYYATTSCIWRWTFHTVEKIHKYLHRCDWDFFTTKICLKKSYWPNFCNVYCSNYLETKYLCIFFTSKSKNTYFCLRNCARIFLKTGLFLFYRRIAKRNIPWSRLLLLIIMIKMNIFLRFCFDTFLMNAQVALQIYDVSIFYINYL